MRHFAGNGKCCFKLKLGNVLMLMGFSHDDNIVDAGNKRDYRGWQERKCNEKGQSGQSKVETEPGQKQTPRCQK
jgi:hypothetical protein